MELSPIQRAKVNDALARVLGAASPVDPVRAVLVLTPPTSERGPSPTPADFPNREAFRRAMIDREAARRDPQVLDALRHRGLHPRGGELGAVAVEGTAEQLVGALTLAGIQHALLDAPMTLVPPRRASSTAG